MQWESRLIRDRFSADQRAGLHLVLPVVLPGCSRDDIPSWLAPAAETYYLVNDFTVAGAETLLRALTGQPGEIEPPLGTRPDLPPRDTTVPPPRDSGAVATVVRPVRRTQVLIEADPANTQWQRDLSVSHEKLGDIAGAAGDLAGARAAFQAALDIRVRLAAADPANTRWQRDLAHVEQKIRELPDSDTES